MTKGTVNISRSIWSDVAFKKQPFTEREAFMWLIMEASYLPREKRVGSVIVQTLRGQCATSVRFMADAWNWPKSTVSRFLKRLENRDMIGTDSGTGVTLVTISKYDDYQAEIKESGTPRKSKAGQQRDSSGTNYKKGLIKDNNITPSISPPEKPKSDRQLFVDALVPMLGAELANDLAKHRTKLKASNTPRAASGLIGKLSQCPNPVFAANEMILRGWKSVEPEWLERAQATSKNGASSMASAAIANHQARQESSPESFADIPNPFLPRQEELYK
ncbi:hypothetical protein [Cohaesibacter gelatinilyticus]|uniref:Helix-turn-helix domain-containing protein n=1 Tax=Cohaesibacter gelatinilyticus TaxID=372072 RepID=A0A285PNJ1_9HYPH|nr:hypothetical protein [Cohaesibacter gelatinilyticus]SNZ21696.1 hypothetical protein SAMN06265368_4821 [Cohaesibacter gelatinilyticus]